MHARARGAAAGAPSLITTHNHTRARTLGEAVPGRRPLLRVPAVRLEDLVELVVMMNDVCCVFCVFRCVDGHTRRQHKTKQQHKTKPLRSPFLTRPSIDACALASARSSTYRSTPLSSGSTLLYASPKSMSTSAPPPGTPPSDAVVAVADVVAAVAVVDGVPSRSMRFDVVRSPCTSPASCSAATAAPIAAIARAMPFVLCWCWCYVRGRVRACERKKKHATSFAKQHPQTQKTTHLPRRARRSTAGA